MTAAAIRALLEPLAVFQTYWLGESRNGATRSDRDYADQVAGHLSDALNSLRAAAGLLERK